MKTCTKCLQEKELAMFARKYKSYTSQCKECRNSVTKKHYQNNKEEYKLRAKNNDKISKEKVRNYVWEYLSTHPCIDCGESNIITLDFDHRDPSSKKCDVGKMITTKHSLNSVKKEIDKCDVRCANCHRIKTASVNGSWKYERMMLNP